MILDIKEVNRVCVSKLYTSADNDRTSRHRWSMDKDYVLRFVSIVFLHEMRR